MMIARNSNDPRIAPTIIVDEIADPDDWGLIVVERDLVVDGAGIAGTVVDGWLTQSPLMQIKLVPQTVLSGLKTGSQRPVPESQLLDR